MENFDEDQAFDFLGIDTGINTGDENLDFYLDEFYISNITGIYEAMV